MAKQGKFMVSLWLGLTLAACDGGQAPKRLDPALFEIQDEEKLEKVLALQEPRSEACAKAKDWDSQWALHEAKVLVIVNQVRARGMDCGEYGKMPKVPPLRPHPQLRCSARLHSKDMAEQDYFDHTSLDGAHYGARMIRAGFFGSKMGENIAAGSSTPAQTVRAWLRSDGHCHNIMEPDFQYLGVGYYKSPTHVHQHFWTQNFGMD